MKKGIVMEVDEEYVTMLTPDGEFVKTKNSKASYEIGEELLFFPVNEQSRITSRKKLMQSKKSKFYLACSLAAVLLLSLLLPMNSSNDVYAYMSIDINPSFEVGLDDELRVVSIEALNDEAKNLLESMPKWKGSTLDSITETIIKKSKDNGYLQDGKQVVITTVVNDTHKADVDKELNKNIEIITKDFEKKNIIVTSVNSSVETREKAKEKGVSTGKLLLEEQKIPKIQPAKEEAVKEIDEKKKEIKGQIKPNHEKVKEKKEKIKKEVKEKKEQIKKDVKDEKKKVKEEINKKIKETKKELKDAKKDEIEQKVKENINNSKMPDDVKKKVLEKLDEVKNWEQ